MMKYLRSGIYLVLNYTKSRILFARVKVYTFDLLIK